MQRQAVRLLIKGFDLVSVFFWGGGRSDGSCWCWPASLASLPPALHWKLIISCLPAAHPNASPPPPHSTRTSSADLSCQFHRRSVRSLPAVATTGRRRHVASPVISPAWKPGARRCSPLNTPLRPPAVAASCSSWLSLVRQATPSSAGDTARLLARLVDAPPAAAEAAVPGADAAVAGAEETGVPALELPP